MLRKSVRMHRASAVKSREPDDRMVLIVVSRLDLRTGKVVRSAKAVITYS